MTFPYRVVFLPGLACDTGAWTAQLAALRDVATACVADYGECDSLPAMADAVLAQAAGECVLVGHSMGGRVALEAYRRAPGRIRGLALLDTGYEARSSGDAGDVERNGRMALVDLARTAGMRTMGRQWVQRMVHPERLRDDALIDAILDMIERKTVSIFEAQERALLDRPDATALLSAIDCPSLVLCGREDGWAPAARHEEMARRIRGASLSIVERCGHMSTMERPDAVNAALAAWLRSISRPAPLP